MPCNSAPVQRQGGVSQVAASGQDVDAATRPACPALPADGDGHCRSATTSSNRPSANGPNQPPQATARVTGGVRTATSPTSSVRMPIAVASRMPPSASTTALIPLVVTRNCGRRVSTLRNAATARCRRAPCGCALNHASLDRPSNTRAPCRAASRASAGCTSSRQIIGATGTSRPPGRRSGKLRAPSPGNQVPAQGNRRRKRGPSSQPGTCSVSGNGWVLR